MKQKLLTEYRYLYSSTKESPKVIRLRIRMRDLISPAALQSAVRTTMERYPYFAVKLEEEDGKFVYRENPLPVVVLHSETGAELNSPESNYHMAAFSWYDNWIVMDIFHGLTDGAGAYEVIRTLLYYYCSERYRVELPEDRIRLKGEEIPPEEWENPLMKLEAPEVLESLSEQRKNPDGSVKNLAGFVKGGYAAPVLPDALNLLREGGFADRTPTVYSIAISESEFMRFNIEHDGSPGTMTALFLSRAIARCFPESSDPVRISLVVNQRTALQAPLAHQCLVGSVLLEYKEKMKSWPVERQATAYRGMVFLGTMEDRVLLGALQQVQLGERIRAASSVRERQEIVRAGAEKARKTQTATVSYVGKANYREAESYIRDFRTWTTAMVPLLLEIAAVNGRFTLDFIQDFLSPVIVEAFLRELEENGITYDLQDKKPLRLPNVRFPWQETGGPR